MSFGHAGWKKEEEEEIKRIGSIKKHLVRLGYNPLEVNWMIITLCENRKLKELDLEEIKKVREALEEQLQMAKKCIEAINSMRMLPN